MRKIKSFIAVILIISLCVTLIGCTNPSANLPDNKNDNYNDNNNYYSYYGSDLTNIKTKDSQYIIAEILQDDLEEYGDMELYVDYVKSMYWSQEYIDEVTYNSLKNDYFGFEYDEICMAMGETNWCFTVENGQTVVIEVPEQSNMIAQLIKKVAIGTGVIVVCAVVSVVSGGIGAAPVACFFAGAAKGALAGAISGGLMGSAVGGLIQGFTTHSMEGAIKGAVDGFGDGFMWGAITGALTGGLTSNTCFSKDTLVKTDQGFKTIDNISVGDMVYSYDEMDNQYEYAMVTDTYRQTSSDIITVITDNESITTTRSHPFLTNRGWLRAESLGIGNKLISTNGQVEVKDIINTNESIDVFNMTVAYNHTYVISESEIVVHNACGDSAKLRRNLINNGENPPTGYKTAAHHIVPAGEKKYEGAIRARKILDERFHIPINAPENGVFLATEKNIAGTTYHRALHTKEYYRKVADFLEQANSYEDAIKILTIIKNSLMNGTFI